jgi:hypothetical protein
MARVGDMAGRRHVGNPVICIDGLGYSWYLQAALGCVPKKMWFGNDAFRIDGRVNHSVLLSLHLTLHS